MYTKPLFSSLLNFSFLSGSLKMRSEPGTITCVGTRELLQSSPQSSGYFISSWTFQRPLIVWPNHGAKCSSYPILLFPSESQDTSFELLVPVHGPAETQLKLRMVKRSPKSPQRL